ncbi:DUF4229 domain-containing protein [Cryobacterium sp. TMT1-2-2]|uniref:DUF4229 domain-containing protein n=1 Tax=Cryobacterium sp. TMT1-2-2 TaxID=1259233 RepID=UPI00106CFCFE|nr:DUF4229 domain-containing protein [Cryobacterium sp. TMT1-2-2]TFD13865.1 DUF4229 domain-containing protein [Cryobacterium sp. TMT1-2-2]
MKSVAPWLYYSVLRVLMFAVPLAILLSLGFWPWASAVIAALIGLCLSYLLLGKSRESVARDLYKARHPDKEPVNPDSEIEDSALNAAEQQSNSERESKSQ